jgi:biopolymer transport protein TolQ
MTASMHAFSSAFSQSDFFGKLIFLGLFILSFVCWMILIYKTWVLSEVNKSSNKFLMYIEKHKGNLLKLQTDNLVHNKFKEIPQPFSKIFSIIKSKTLELLEKNHFFIHESQNASSVYLSRADIDLIENHLLATIMTQKELLEKNVFMLSTISHLAPFIGLLGTVWGILMMFAGLQMSGNFASNATVLGGLSTALATTVLGLLIAIPSLVAHSFIKQKIKTYTCQMQDFGHFLLSTIEIQYRKVDLS